MTPPLDARAKRSQDALLRAGLELFNINPEASLSDIAAHAGVGRTTLYRQYETREKLLRAIAVHCLESIESATAPIETEATSVLGGIRLLFELAMPLTQELQFLINLDQMLENDPEVAAVIGKQRGELMKLVELGKKTGEIRGSLPTDWVVNLIDGLFYVGWLQQREGEYSTDQIAEFAYTSFSRGVSAG